MYLKRCNLEIVVQFGYGLKNWKKILHINHKFLRGKRMLYWKKFDSYRNIPIRQKKIVLPIASTYWKN